MSFGVGGFPFLLSLLVLLYSNQQYDYGKYSDCSSLFLPLDTHFKFSFTTFISLAPDPARYTLSICVRAGVSDCSGFAFAVGFGFGFCIGIELGCIAGNSCWRSAGFSSPPVWIWFACIEASRPIHSVSALLFSSWSRSVAATALGTMSVILLPNSRSFWWYESHFTSVSSIYNFIPHRCTSCSPRGPRGSPGPHCSFSTFCSRFIPSAEVYHHLHPLWQWRSQLSPSPSPHPLPGHSHQQKYFCPGGMASSEWTPSVRGVSDSLVAECSAPNIHSTRRLPYCPLIAVSPFLLVLSVACFKRSLWHCGQLSP